MQLRVSCVDMVAPADPVDLLIPDARTKLSFVGMGQ
jgi:hypothetical protein